MGPFESLGFFGIPGRDDSHPGLFSFDPISGSSVKLARPLDDTANRDHTLKRGLVHGVLLDPPSGFGNLLSLVNVFRTQFSYGPSGSSETLHAARAYLGNAPLSTASFSMERVEVQLSHLDRWLGISGLGVSYESDEFVPRVTYERPQPVDVRGRSCDYSFATVGSVSGRHREISVREEARLVVRPTDPTTAVEIDRMHLAPLRQFVSLAVDGPVALRRVTYWLDSERESQIDLLIQQQSGEREPALLPGDVLFDGTPDNVSTLLPKWLAFAESHRPFTNLFFALVDNPPRYVEWQFVLAMEALQLLARSTDIAGITAWLRGVIPTRQIVPDPDAWTRALFQKRAALWSTEHVEGIELFGWTEQIRWISKAAMLEHLGLAVPENNRAFSRCPQGIPPAE